MPMVVVVSCAGGWVKSWSTDGWAGGNHQGDDDMSTALVAGSGEYCCHQGVIAEVGCRGVMGRWWSSGVVVR